MQLAWLGACFPQGDIMMHISRAAPLCGTAQGVWRPIGVVRCPGARSAQQCAGGSPAWTALSLLPMLHPTPPADRLLPHLRDPEQSKCRSHSTAGKRTVRGLQHPATHDSVTQAAPRAASHGSMQTASAEAISIASAVMLDGACPQDHLQSGQAQGGPSLSGSGLELRAQAQESLHSLTLASVCCQVQWGEASLDILATHRCPSLHQGCYGIQPPMHGCIVEWSSPCKVRALA